MSAHPLCGVSEQNSIQDHGLSKVQSLGLDSEDVEEILHTTFPATRQFLQLLPNPQTRTLITREHGMEKLIKAAKEVLQSWKIVRSFAVDVDGAPALYILKCTDRYFEKAIVSLPDVHDEAALAQIELEGHHRKGELPQGLLFKIAICKAAANGACALIFTINHAIMDDWMRRRLITDFGAALDGEPLCEKVDWSAFSDMYSAYSTSQLAQEAVTNHLKSLEGIGSLQDSLWPPKFDHADQAMGAALPSSQDLSLEAVHKFTYLIHYKSVRRIPKLRTCLAETGVRPSIITKAAIALFNCKSTGTWAALLAVILSGRAWPFVPASVAKVLPHPKLIAGPTITMCTDAVRFDPKETVFEMLHRLDQEQRQITLFPHRPLWIIDKMEAADKAIWARGRRQVFNWLSLDRGSARNGNKRPSLELLIERKMKIDEPDDTYTWRCRPIDEEQLEIEVITNRLKFAQDELHGYIEDVFDLIEILSDACSKDKEVGSLFQPRNGMACPAETDLIDNMHQEALLSTQKDPPPIGCIPTAPINSPEPQLLCIDQRATSNEVVDGVDLRADFLRLGDAVEQIQV